MCHFASWRIQGRHEVGPGDVVMPLHAEQVTCVNVRSYGLVTMPSLLPASLESLWVGTKARGRRLGPSLLMPKASELPSVKVGVRTGCLVQ